MEHCRTLGVHARVLPENRTIVPYLEKKMLDLGITGPEGFLQSRPEELESERVNSLCVLSQLSNCPVSVLSISSAESLAALERARCSGAIAHAEIASAAMVADGTHYFNKCLKHASTHMTEVPLRTEGSSKLISALASQPLAVCTSGHRAISTDSRLCAKDFTSMPKGTVGVEERMCVVWEKAVRTGRIDPMRFVAVTSTNAAKMFNLYPKKGRIAVGADADLVLWDASGRWKLSAAERQSSVDLTVYEGMTVHAQAAVTIVGGRVAWKDGKIQDVKGGFIQLSPNSPYLFSVVQQRDKINTAEKVDRADAPGVSSNGHLPRRGNPEPSPFDRPIPRKSHMESNISFGVDSRPATTRVRNPPGGRTTGFCLKMALLIKNGTVVNEDAMFNADILVKDGIIVEVAPSINAANGVQVLDAKGKMVIPGGIDPHTHMQLPFMGEVAVDDFYQGTRAALAGGTTMIIDFVIPTKDSTPLAAYKQWREWADPKVCCDYGLSMAITSWNKEIERQMEEVVKPEYGINSFKFFLAYSGLFMVRDEEFFQGNYI
ncbi:unnamed protein product [Haemonchus placei]|uniref:Amidohydrolase-related domain-containing protein n=1 Tax=Haemonchus placei TaxID=6290 RepID=A0A3P8C6X1_HAEPC|nr:unnamed protein product [Haemonchus placei]